MVQGKNAKHSLLIGRICVGLMLLCMVVGCQSDGVTKASDYVDGLYYIVITAPKTEGEVQLCFYSPELKRIFLANETFSFVNNFTLGTPSEPFKPTWKVQKD